MGRGQARADEGEQQPQRLEEVVVTASRGEQAAADAPSSTSVVKAEDMEKRNVQTVDQAVNLLPGVFGRRGKGPADTLASITLRGIPGQSRTLVLLDGVPLNDGYTGGVQLGGLRPQEIQRLEVVRGPMSSLYGSSGMGGVVNLITEMPERRALQVNMGYGSAWTREEAPAATWKLQGSYGDLLFEKLHLYAGFGYEATDGFPANLAVSSSAPAAPIAGAIRTTDVTGKARYIVGDTGENRWHDYSGSIRLQYDFDPSSNVRLSYRRSGYDYAYGPPHSYLRDGSGAPVFSYGSTSPSVFLSGDGSKTLDAFALSAETLLGEAKAKLNLGLSRHGSNWYVSPTAGATGATPSGGPGKLSSTPDTSLFVDLQLSQPVLERHLITAGVSLRRDSADSKETNLSDWRDEGSTGDVTYQAGGRSVAVGVFVQGEVALLDELTAYVGLRDDYWRTSGGYAIQAGAGGFANDYAVRSKSALSPKASLVWRPADGTVLRGEVGRAFRAPTIYELYRTWSSTTGQKTTVYQSNPDLSPETVVSWSLGGEQALWPDAKLAAAFFDNDLRDMVYTVTLTDSATAGTKRASNVGSARSYGVELQADQTIRDVGRIFASYTYTTSAITRYDANTALVGKQLTQLPKHMAAGGAEGRWGALSGSVTVRYLAKRFGSDDDGDTVSGVYGSYDAYLLTDLLIAYRPRPWATVSLAIDNLFNRNYYAYYRAPRRSWSAQVTLTY
jgi:iron complex outermembrane receptor protein